MPSESPTGPPGAEYLYELTGRNNLPLVTVTGQNWRALDHHAAGQWVSHAGDPITPARVMPFAEAFTAPHQQDLFAVMYGVVSVDPDHEQAQHQHLATAGYRLTTSAPVALEEAATAGMGTVTSRSQVVGVMFAIDMDLKDVRFLATGKVTTEKISWTQDLRDRFIDELWEPACQKMPILRRPTLWYTTAHGMRLIYCLDHPIQMLGIGGHFDRYRGLLVDMFLAGIPVDRATKDWTRLQRLPMVMRQQTDARGQVVDTIATWSADYFRMSWGRVDPNAVEEVCPEAVVVYSPEAFAPITGRQPGIEGYTQHPQFPTLQSLWLGVDASILSGSLREHVECGRQPSEEEALGLLYRDGDHRKPTIGHKNLREQITKTAKKAGTGNGHAIAAANIFSVLWEGKRLDHFTDPPSIHHATYSVAYEICRQAEDQMGLGNGQINPQMVYALILPLAQTANEARIAEEAEGTPRTEGELADEVWRAVCHAFSWRWNHREQKRREEQEDCVHLSESSQGIEKLIIDYFIAQGWPEEDASQNWRQMQLMDSDAGVSCICIRDGDIYWSDPRNVKFSWLTAAARSAPSSVRIFDTNKEGDQALRYENDLLAEYGTPIGDNIACSRLIKRSCVERKIISGRPVPKLWIKIPGTRTDIVPTYHADIDEWLRAFGETNPEQFLNHMSTFPDLKKHWPGLYKHGLADEGKNLLVEGCKRIIESYKAAQFMDAAGGFQDALKDTPLLVVNEGSSTANGQFQKSVTEVMRDYIGSDETWINLKGKKGVHVDGGWRVIITANHDGALDWGQNLTQVDEEAIRKRVGFYGPSARAAEILRKAGGRTGNEYGPGTEVTRWPDRLAEHIMWLHANRIVKPSASGRFALEIENTSWHERQRAKGSGQLELCRAIATMIRASAHNEEAIKIVKVAKNKQRPGVYISPEQFYREMVVLNISDRTRLPPIERVIRTLKSMCHDGHGKPVQYRTCKKTVVRGLRLDVANFLSVLHGYELDCDLREELGEAWSEASLDVRRAVEETETVGDDDEPATYGTYGAAPANVGGIIQFPGTHIVDNKPG